MSDQTDQHPARHAVWQSPFVQNVMPFMTSLVFHAAIVVIGLLMYQSVRVLTHRQAQMTDVLSPFIQDNAITDPLDSISGPLSKFPSRPMQNEFRVDSNGANNQIGHTPDSARRIIGPTQPDDSSMADVIGAASSLIGMRSNGRDGDGGPLAPFGSVRTPGGGSGIFGNGPGKGGPPAQSVVYLCDASGSMLNKFATLRQELTKAIQGLRPVQSFGLTFFQDTHFSALSPQLLMATPANKARAMDFLDNVTPRSSTDPLPGLEAAFKQKPQLIFLLTDGDFPNNQAVLQRTRALNRTRAVRINTIAFVGEGDTDTDFIKLLEQIARENGGVYRHVVESDLN
jgi:hypothetical protein